ncbi:hypothetical protein Dimus_006233, partial [Dionaea muscipula]
EPAPMRIIPLSRCTKVSKSVSLSSQHDKEVMDAFWDTLLRIDGTTGSTVAGLSPDVRQEEAVQKQEKTASYEDKGKALVEVNPSCPTGVTASAAQTSSTTPTPPQNLKVQRSILDSVNQTPDARIAAAYAWMDEGLYPRDNEILLATDPRRLRGDMMVNQTEMLKERLELNKKKRKDLTNVLNEYEERSKVNAVKEFVHSSRFEDGLARVIGSTLV